MTVEITTTHGRIRGMRAGEGVIAATGIPYAAPPFGAYRFQPPQVPVPWHDVRECRDFGPIPPQPAMLPGGPEWEPGQEDVLTVNVWAPESAADLPVLVWVHGGAYIFGSSAEPMYDGTNLARLGLVVVTCNYRVGFEGFGHVPDAPDNRALLDVSAVLRWVGDNIAGFGGDPGNVTLAGQSAGAGLVASLMTLPPDDAPFHRAIAHSAPAAFLTDKAAAAVTARIADAAATTPTRLADLPPERLVEATGRVLAAYPESRVPGVRAKASTVFAPVVDGRVLRRRPLAAIAAGARDVPLLALHTMDEYRLFAALDPELAVADDTALAGAAEELGLGGDGLAGYRKLNPEGSREDLFCAMKGDARFAEFTTRLAEAHAAAGAPAHLSRLALASTALGGACHALELPLCFGNLDSGLATFMLDGLPDARLRELSARMMGAWAAFARGESPGWAPLTTTATPVRTWDFEDSDSPADTAPFRELWREVAL